MTGFGGRKEKGEPLPLNYNLKKPEKPTNNNNKMNTNFFQNHLGTNFLEY